MEYEFILPDGTKRYEIIDTEPDALYTVAGQINRFMTMHKAICCRRVDPEEEFGANLPASVAQW